MAPQLAAEFRTALADYLTRIEAVQADLMALHRRKRIGLTAADTAALEALAVEEQAATDRLAALVAERGQMLAQAARFGLPAGSLTDLVPALGMDAAVSNRVAACRRRAAALRREGWVHWVIVKRGLAHTAAMLDLIAHRGDRPTTYGDSRSGGPSRTGGGSLLDASA